MATFASKLRPSAVDGQTIRVLPDGRIRGNAGMEPFSAGTKGGAPSVFYADGNVVSSGNGLGWLSAVKTLAEALTLAHTYMSTSGNRAWAQRATIYCCADNFTEDITAFAEKTDIIGVGSCNQFARPRIEGTHVLVATTTDTYHGCHWHNVEWYGAAAGIIVDIPANQNGQGFYNCIWQSTDAATIGLRAVQSHDMEIVGCKFIPNTSGAGFSTAAIQINAGSVTNFLLQDCRIWSGALGIDFNPTAATAINCWAIDNIMRTVGMGIDSESNNGTHSLICIGNRMVTLIDTGVYTTGFDFVEAMAIDNTVTGSGGETDVTPLPETTAN